MNFEVVLTCAVTGAGDTVGKSDKIPVSAKEIADDAIRICKSRCYFGSYTCERSNKW